MGEPLERAGGVDKMRLWMLSGTTVAAATAMGLTLGSYAVSPVPSVPRRCDERAIRVLE